MMYGLFENTYDYYKWQDLVCVSKDKDLLIKKAESIKNLELLEGEEQIRAENGEIFHLVIEEVEEL